ncbi:MAG: tetratricopeptide repeat-containing protein [Rhodospirillales bacterium]|nr:tetratricopeptide repeat-containing protein [Rhodospirillales bacterium]
MNIRLLPFLCLAASLLSAAALPALAQNAEPNPQQLQAMINNGQSGQAIEQLNIVLNQHPDSGTAWFLMAEAQDAQGNENSAAQALGKADQYAPGLPFANPQKAAALRAHINGGISSSTIETGQHHGISPVLLVIGGLILLFVLLRLFSGVRRQQAYRAYPGGPNAPYGSYPPGGTNPYGPAGYSPMGGGFGSSIISGLAAGAGFAAGERIVDGMMGGYDAQAAQPQQDFSSSRDDGLLGNPGWDDSGNIDDSLDNNNW